MELETGKLYRVIVWDVVWKANPELLLPFPRRSDKVSKIGTKKIFCGNVLLFLERKKFMTNGGELFEIYAFLDKDGVELWLEENEIEFDLEEAKE